MKTLNVFAYVLLFLSLGLVCISLLEKDIQMLGAAELLFFLGIVLIYLSNKFLEKSN
jgi:hypothetical protein